MDENHEHGPALDEKTEITPVGHLCGVGLLLTTPLLQEEDGH